jgi:exonuclease SbcC
MLKNMANKSKIWIPYIKLKNMIGIWSGMKKKEFSMEFPDPDTLDSPIYLLQGNNGSGKTTLLSFLNPFLDTHDNRTNLVLEGEEGFKEIHIMKNSDKYEIQHYYRDSGNKSYIQKNGEELNPKGLRGEFKDIVKKELGVDEDYFKIGRIGNNVTNFIDMTTAKRKRYINKFIPNIDDYLEAFRNAKENYDSLKNEIKFIADQIDKLDDEENLEVRKESLEGRIEVIQESIDDINSEINKNKGKIEEIDSSEELINNGNPYKDKYENAKKNYREADQEYNKYVTKFPSIMDMDLETINDSMNSSKESLASMKEKLESKSKEGKRLKEEVQELKNDIKEKNDRIDNLKSDNSLDELKDMKESKEKQLEKKKDKLDNFDIKVPSEIKNQELFEIKNVLENAEEVIRKVKREKDDDFIDKVFELLDDGSFDGEVLQSKLTVAKRTTSRIEDDVERFKSERDILEEHLKQKKILNKRPENCNIDGCPFIRNALRYKDVDKRLAEKEDRIEEETNAKEDSVKEEERFSEILSIYEALDKNYDKIKNYMSTFMKVGLNNFLDSFDKFARLINAPNKKLNTIFNIDDMVEYVQVKKDINDLSNNIGNLDDKIEMIEKQDEIIEGLEEDLDKIKDNKEEKEDLYDDVKEKFSEYKKAVKKLKDKIQIYENVKDLLETKNENKKVMSDNKDLYEEYEEKIEKINEIEKVIKSKEESLEEKVNKINPLKEELDQVNTDINKLEDFKERKESVKEDYHHAEVVKTALDPIRGIPLFFIDGYLKETAKIANDLLDISHKGKFRLSFDIDDKNFYIRVHKDDGTMVDDISETSQGEEALSSVSLSFALIEQGIENYNILQLDEIDGTLSGINRRSFLTMMEKQIEKLNVNQLFIISHNKEFDAYPINLILLEDHEVDTDDESYIENKNIVYNIYDEKDKEKAS